MKQGGKTPITPAGGASAPGVEISDSQLDGAGSGPAPRRSREGDTPVSGMLDAMLVAAPDCIITIDHEGRILEFNPAAEQTFGYTRSQALGRPMVDLIIPPSLRQRHLRGFAHYLATGESHILGRRVEVTALRADGTELRVELTVSRVPVGGAPLFTAYLRDSTERKRAEIEMQERAQQFRGLFEQAAVGMAQVSLGGRLLRVNQRLSDFLGYSAEELLARRVEDITYPDDLDADLTHLQRLLDGEIATYLLEKRYVRKDGALVWGNLAVSLVRSAEGQPLYVVAVVEDITARKLLQERLRQAEREATARARQFETLFDAISDGIFVYDAEGRIVQANAAVRALFAFETLPDYASRPLDERVPLVDTRDEHGRPLPMDQWPQRRVLRGEVLGGESARDYRLRVLDGRDVVVNVSGAPIRDVKGGVVGGVLILRDVTERRRLERRTREALDALLAMAETLVSVSEDDQASSDSGQGAAQVRVGMYAAAREMAELTRRVLGCERVSLAELDSDMGRSRPLAVVGLPAAMERVWWTTVSALRAGDYTDASSLARLRAGEPVVLEFAQRRSPDLPAYDAEKTLVVPMLLRGELVGTLTVGYGSAPHTYSADEMALAAAIAKLATLVVERERLQQEREAARASVMALREANRRMDEFMGIAAHELKTPVTTIKTNVQVILRRLQTASRPGVAPEELARVVEAARTFLGRAERGSERLARLVDDMLDVSRIQAGKLELHLEQCDLATVVRESVEEQRQLNPRRTITLDLPPDDNVAVAADVDRIGQVVTNYVTNALKYSREFHPVAVALRIEGDMARVSVRDAGPGLSEEEHERVWEMFHRAPGVEVQTGSGVGLGLGLHISKTIVERHGGQVGVESTPGDGSMFWFTLPLTRD